MAANFIRKKRIIGKQKGKIKKILTICILNKRVVIHAFVNITKKNYKCNLSYISFI